MSYTDLTGCLLSSWLSEEGTLVVFCSEKLVFSDEYGLLYSYIIALGVINLVFAL